MKIKSVFGIILTISMILGSVSFWIFLWLMILNPGNMLYFNICVLGAFMFVISFVCLLFMYGGGDPLYAQ